VSKQHYENNKQSYLERVRAREVLVIEENQKKLAEYLASHPCVDCGCDDIRVLEFDHVRGKSASITNLLKNTAPWKTIEAEIAKCEVRCVNCHRIRTGEQGGWWRYFLQKDEEEY